MRILYRNKVAYALHELFHYPIMSFYAPVGYGKTTMVLDFMRYLKEIDLVYFSIQTESDMQWGWYKSIEKLREVVHLPLWIQNVRKDDGFIEICASELKAQLKNTTIFILDDCGWRKQSELVEAWIKLASNHIPKFHLLLLSEESPSRYLHELEAKGLCKIYGSNLFLFDQEEIEQLAFINAISIGPDVLKQIYVLSNGWSSAVCALLQCYQEHGTIQDKDVQRMLEDAVFWKLDPVLRVVLMKLAVLKDFTLEQAVFITKDKKTCLEIYQLAKENFFMRIQKDTEARTMISPVLKEILKKHLMEEGIDVKQIYERAGKWEEGHRHYQMAFY